MIYALVAEREQNRTEQYKKIENEFCERGSNGD